MSIKTHGRDAWDEHWADLNEITEINPAQHYRHKLLVNTLRASLEDSHVQRIFDFGSGQGDLIQMIRSHLPNYQYYGLELSKTGIDIAKIKNPDAQFYQCNLLESSHQVTSLYGKAEFCICSEVLEHLDEPVVALKNIRRYMAKNAKIIITVPGGLMNQFEKSIGHRRHYSKSALEALVKESGLHVTHTMRAGFPFFNAYKLLAFARGKALLKDTSQNSKTQGAMLFVLNIFKILFKLNMKNSPFGWQMLVIAENRV